MVRAVIFDLDGVIVDTAKYHYLAWKRLARELGFDFSEGDNEKLKGVSRMRSLDVLLETGGLQGRFTPQEKERMAACKNGWYLEYVSAMAPDEILPGVTEFIGGLRGKGVKTALGSASRNTPLILSRLGISGLFDVVVDGNMVSHAKPDPEVFVTAARLLGENPADCVVFEDAQAGVEAARNAGMRCVGVGDPATLSGADIAIFSFEGFTVEKFENEMQ